MNLLHSLVIFFLVTGFCVSCEKYGIRSGGETDETAESFFSELLNIQDYLPGLSKGGDILWNTLVSVVSYGGETTAIAANKGGEILRNAIASAATEGGGILWNTLVSAAKSTICSEDFDGEDYQEMSLEESDVGGDVEIESFYSVSGSTDGDGDGEIETAATTLGDAHGPFIYIDTINVYNYCGKCENKS